MTLRELIDTAQALLNDHPDAAELPVLIGDADLADLDIIGPNLDGREIDPYVELSH